MYIFLLVYAINNHKKKYKEKVLSLAKIDFNKANTYKSRAGLT